MSKVINPVLEWLKDVFSNTYAFASGLAASALSYFEPIKNPITFLIILFSFDCAIGAYKNWKLYKQPFSKRKVFNTTVPRMVSVVLFMMLLYGWDTTFNQDFVNTYMAVGYFIGGVLLWNVAMNMYKVTKWKAFKKIGSLIEKNVEDKTTMKINEDDKK